MKALSCLLLAAFLFGVFAGDHLGVQKCSLLSKCKECNEASGCEWCTYGEHAHCSNKSISGDCMTTACLDYSCSSLECNSIENCTDCVKKVHCGWDTRSQTCKFGNGTGSCSAKFEDSADWGFTNCSRNCPFYNASCSECTEHFDVDACEWCAADNTCFYAFQSKTCECPRKPKQCHDCAALHTCSECTKVASCGWCGDPGTHGTGKCIAATLDNGPCGTCENPERNWHYNSCQANCSRWSTSGCGACVGQSTCQWCEDSLSCQPALAAVRAMAVRTVHLGTKAACTCTATSAGQCTAYDHCHDLKDCESCTASANCGWCSKTESCLAGVKSGPCKEDGCPSGWAFDNCTRDCAAFNASCAECTNHVDEGCRWCLDSDACVHVSEKLACTCPSETCNAIDCAEMDGTSCLECTSKEGCGWCEGSKTCLAGSAGRPCSHCKVGWTTQCNNECLSSETCADCLKVETCGWCAGTPSSPALEQSSLLPPHSNVLGRVTSLCLAGSGKGPADGTSCTRWHKDTCSACASYKTCEACSEDPECGWCGGDVASGKGGGGYCTEGVAAGPFRPEPPASCPTWNFDNCENMCPSFTGCDDCLKHPACGWCHDRQSPWSLCVGKSFRSMCEQWNVDSCSTQCGDYTMCDACTKNSSCGWCVRELKTSERSVTSVAEKATCVAGTGSGPSMGICDQWSYGPRSCAPFECSAVTTCDACTSHPTCGWCESHAVKCEKGSSAGPEKGTCPDGKWAWGPISCQSPITSCSSQGTCGDCIAAGECGWCDGNSCVRGGKDGPYPPNKCTSSWLYVTCSPDIPFPPPPPEGLSTLDIVGITAACILVPVIIISLVVYRRFVNKYGYTPLG